MRQARGRSLAVQVAILATLLAAAVGSASALTVTGGSVQAGNDNSLRCDVTGVTVGYTTVFVGGTFKVTHVTVTGLHNDCIGKLVDVVLTQSGVPIASANGTVLFLGPSNNRSTGPLAVAPQPLASAVTDVHVLVKSDPGP